MSEENIVEDHFEWLNPGGEADESLLDAVEEDHLDSDDTDVDEGDFSGEGGAGGDEDGEGDVETPDGELDRDGDADAEVDPDVDPDAEAEAEVDGPDRDLEGEPPEEASDGSPAELGDELSDHSGSDDDVDEDTVFDMTDLDDEFGDLSDDEEDDPDDDPAHGSSAIIGGSWSDTAPKRDERIAEYSGDASHEAVREFLRGRDVMEDLKREIQQLSVEEYDTTDTEGDLLDMRNVVRRLAGDTTVDDYYRARDTRESGKMAVGVSVDFSGSMAHVEKEVKAAVGAFLFAVQEAGGDVVANAWQAEGGQRVRLITGPGEEFAWRHLNTSEPGGSDPLAQGAWECAEMLEHCDAEDKLLIVITDGQPTVISRKHDEFSDAVAESSDTVDELRERFPVVGFGFGDISEENLEDIFGDEDLDDDGDGYRHVEIDDLDDALVDVYREQVPDAGTEVVHT